MEAIIARNRATILLRGLLLATIGTMLANFMVVNTFTSIDIPPAGGGAIKLFGQTFSDGLQVTLVAQGIKIAPSTDAVAVGDTLSGEVEVTSSLPEVTTAVTKGDYVYAFEVKEPSAADWSAIDGANDLIIEVYGNDGSISTLLATFYASQGVAEAGNIEGVTGTVDLGSSSVIYGSFNVVVTHQ